MEEYGIGYLRQKYYHDLNHDWERWSEIKDEISQKYCCKAYFESSYAELVYKLDYPDQSDTENFQAANYSENGFTPILLQGIVVENQLDEDGTRLLRLVTVKERKTYDAETLLLLRDCADVLYTIAGWNLYSNREEYAIGDLRQVKPGTKVIIAAAYVSVSSRNKQKIELLYTDVAPETDLLYLFVDEDYRIHQSEEEYLALYDKIAREKKSTGSTSTSSEGCYIATAVYKSYDCPEVWTLRRYRDSVLYSTWYGRLFIKIYYKLSPIAVKWLGDKAWFTSAWKKVLDPIVEKLQRTGFAGTKYTDK